VEITLDLSFVRRILTEERAAALRDIRTLGVEHALARSQRRHDARVASAPDSATLACRPGCDWCCYFSVDVRPAEVFSILDFVERTFTADEQTRVYSEVRANSALLKGLDEDARATRNVKCPFLHDGRCTVYAVRPQSCRNYHATDVTGCQKSYEQPENLDIDPEFAPWVYQAGTAHVEAFSAAVHASGLDVRAYELSCALDAAMTDPASRKRFESGLPPFVDLAGEDVPPEFDDLVVGDAATRCD
jgi:Fe-S-cluster containining protein